MGHAPDLKASEASSQRQSRQGMETAHGTCVGRFVSRGGKSHLGNLMVGAHGFGPVAEPCNITARLRAHACTSALQHCGAVAQLQGYPPKKEVLESLLQGAWN